MSKGGKYGAILAVQFITIFSMGYTAMGEPVVKSFYKNEDNAELQRDFEFMKKWIKVVNPLLAQGKSTVHPPK